MKRFRYQLEAVMRLRQWELQDEQAALGAANARQALQQQRVKEISAQQSQILEHWTVAMSPDRPVSVEELANGFRYYVSITAQLDAAQQEALRLVEDRDTAALNVARCQRVVDGFEEHRVDCLVQFRRSQANADNKEADERWNMLTVKSITDEHRD